MVSILTRAAFLAVLRGLVVAADTGQPGGATNQDVLESLRDRGTRFTIAEGETKAINLDMRN